MTAPAQIAGAMRLAVEQSQAVKGATYPNPPVGAVILDASGDIAGTGATEPAGGAHAEVLALRAAGGRASGGTAVVTLEPCNHHGRTPPCVDALLAAGVAAVVYAVEDPNPVASGGAERLRAAGVAVTPGVGTEDVSAGPLREWLHKQRTGFPMSHGNSPPASTDAVPPRTDPRSGSPARPPAPICTAAGRPRMPSSWAPERCSLTTPA